MADKKTDHFTVAIRTYLDTLAADSPSFLQHYTKEAKTIDKCVKYIYKCVKESGRQGYADNEVYDMAVHYYETDEVIVDGEIQGLEVIVNHSIALSEEEVNEAKATAKREIIAAEKSRLKKKKPVVKEVKKPLQTSLF